MVALSGGDSTVKIQVLADHWGKITSAILGTVAVFGLLFGALDRRVSGHIEEASDPIIDLLVVTITRLNTNTCAIEGTPILDCDTYKGVPDQYNPSKTAGR